jgi:hypothetical protein
LARYWLFARTIDVSAETAVAREELTELEPAAAAPKIATPI